MTDETGAVHEMTQPVIDYSDSLRPYSDVERGGVRAKQGSGTVTLSWSDIAELRVIEVGDTGIDCTAEVVLTSGETLTFTLPHAYVPLQGGTTLGYFSIELIEVTKIEVLR